MGHGWQRIIYLFLFYYAERKSRPRLSLPGVFYCSTPFLYMIASTTLSSAPET